MNGLKLVLGTHGLNARYKCHIVLIGGRLIINLNILSSKNLHFRSVPQQGGRGDDPGEKDHR